MTHRHSLQVHNGERSKSRSASPLDHGAPRLVPLCNMGEHGRKSLLRSPWVKFVFANKPFKNVLLARRRHISERVCSPLPPLFCAPFALACIISRWLVCAGQPPTAVLFYPPEVFSKGLRYDGMTGAALFSRRSTLEVCPTHSLVCVKEPSYDGCTYGFTLTTTSLQVN